MLGEKYTKLFPEYVSFDWFMARKGDVYREMDGRTTLRFREKGYSYFIKKHLGIGWGEVFKNLMQLKLPVLSAKNEFVAINKLTALGVDTMTLVAYGVRGRNPAKVQSFVVTEDLVDTISLEDYCASWGKGEAPTFREKQLLISKVAHITKTMHHSGMNHRDLYICHFLLRGMPNVSTDFKLFLIDLHRAQVRKKVPERWLVKDLAALYFSAMHIGLTKRDLLRFIKQYKGGSVRGALEGERLFWKKVSVKAHTLNNQSIDR